MNRIRIIPPGQFYNLDYDLNNSSVVYVHEIGKIYATVSNSINSARWQVSKYRLTEINPNNK